MRSAYTRRGGGRSCAPLGEMTMTREFGTGAAARAADARDAEMLHMIRGVRIRAAPELGDADDAEQTKPGIFVHPDDRCRPRTPAGAGTPSSAWFNYCLPRSAGRFAVFLVFAALLVLPPDTGARAERVERNFKVTGTVSARVPAVPLSELDVSEGTVRVRIGASRYTLETLTVSPPGAGPFPLAVISHGTPTRPGSEARQRLRIRENLPIAQDFAQRGYRATVFARRGYAGSSGKFRESYGRCDQASKRSYVLVAREGAKDFTAVIQALRESPEVDGANIIAVGHSGGGFVASALAQSPPPGLIGIVNLAGGRGASGGDENCSTQGFVGAFATFGEGATVPALWLYSVTDHLFGPRLVDEAFDAYAAGGAPVRLERLDPLWFSGNGHLLHLAGAREYWSPPVDDFLSAIGAPTWERAPEGIALKRLPAPASLGERGARRWRLYLGVTGHKAFAVDSAGGRNFGWSAVQGTRERAIAAALHDCEKRGGACRVVAVDNEPTD